MKYRRLYKIITVARAYDLTALLPAHRFSFWLKLIIGCLFWVKPKAKGKPISERLRLALQTLGPVWIKFGQMISTRRDLLTPELATQLALLQDKVDPFSGDDAARLVADALGQPLESIFGTFDRVPLASASIAQVHSATLKRSGIEVVVKVLRPNLQPIIEQDISLLYFLADKLPLFIKDAERLRATDVVRDYQQTLLQELNLLREADNTLKLRDNFIDSDMLYIPFVYRDLCRKNVLVEERIYGVPISQIEQLKAANVNLPLLAERGVQAFFTQVFRDNFFHADMHPGNIFVDISDPNDPRYIGIDCAIVGELTKDDQTYLAENFLAFFNRDYRKIAQLYIDSGWVADTTSVYELELAMRQVCEPIFAKPFGQISFSQVLLQLFHIARQFSMEVQPQLVLLEKTLFYIEGLGRQLYPQLDLWQTAKPFLEGWYQRQYSVQHMMTQFIAALPQWQTLLPHLPERIQKTERANQQLKTQLRVMAEQLHRRQQRQNRFIVIMTSLIVGCMVIATLLLR